MMLKIFRGKFPDTADCICEALIKIISALLKKKVRERQLDVLLLCSSLFEEKICLCSLAKNKER